jgi:gamma-glutamyltranspeptidase/glutathione hydrolase
MYLDSEGNVNRDTAVNGALAAGIPGQPAALVHLTEHYGKLPLSTTLAPAIKAAHDGFFVHSAYTRLAGYRLKNLQRYPESASTFLAADGSIPKVGSLLIQKDHALTLKAIAKKGLAGFYDGPIAAKLVKAVRDAGGIWTLDDLKNYRIIERQPIVSQYHDYTVVSAPPPSSGGIAIASMLNMLELYPYSKMLNIEKTHLVTEIMRRAYKDRAEFLGDPDFVTVPTDRLIDKDYAKQLAQNISMTKATPSLSLNGPKNVQEGFHTTHFSILDQQGNRVSATLSINLPFGSAFVAKGTGVVLNNEMDDFSAKPGEPNAYGLVGNAANAIAPGKRPLSSMSPSFVEHKNSVAILGTPGGSRIITMVLLGMLEYMDEKNVAQWVNKPRFHHQYLPDEIQHEPDTFTAQEKQQLEHKGHTLKNVGRTYGNMHAILWDKKSHEVTAASDKRGVGEAKTYP